MAEGLDAMIDAAAAVVRVAYEHPELPIGLIFRNGQCRLIMSDRNKPVMESLIAEFLAVDPAAEVTSLSGD